MLAALRHRGPDGAGHYADSRALLGHRRLAIIDLEGGRQPLENADGTLALVCNGEIYNYQALRRELEADGYQFRTQSDCEVILGLYERYGDQLLHRLRGMFAFALWDARRRRLFCARDHLGQKPFFYAERNGAVAFASEPKALLTFDPQLRRLNLQALDQYLALRLVASPLTMFEGIHKLPPAHMLSCQLKSDGTAGSIQISEYWRAEYGPKLQGDEADLIDQLEAQIEEALRLHMVSDVTVGAFLSGGLDSSLLVALLSRKLGVRKLPTFTVSVAYQNFDEAPHARRIAELYGTEHHEHALDLSLAKGLPQLIHHLDEPSDPLSLCSFQLARFTSRHVKAVIGGDGGDELFGGYDRYYGNLYAERYAHIPAFVRRGLIGPALSLLPRARWYKSRIHQARWLHQLSFLSGAERYAASLRYFYFPNRTPLYTPQTAERLAGFSAEAPIVAAYEAIDAAPLDRMLYADSRIRLPDHPVTISDRTSMAHGLEVRSPFMDHVLAEFAARLPCETKVRGRTARYLQRKLAVRYLPADILERPKQGFSSALPYLLKDEYSGLYHRYLRHSRLVEAGVLNPQSVETLFAAHRDGKQDHGNRLWLLINSELWYRMVIEGERLD